MADYWKSIDKKYCDVCKCWLTDNTASVAFHENGNRHKMNIQNRLREINKKSRSDKKTERKFANEMRKIENAATAASRIDMEANPDVTMKIQNYFNELKAQGGGDLPDPEQGTSSSAKKAPQPTILHRSDKQKKADEAHMKNMNKPKKGYQRLDWDTSKSSTVENNFLELPSKSSKSPGTALQLSAKVEEKEKITFTEKSAGSFESLSSNFVKSEQSEVCFKKRKLNKSSMRQREEDNN